MIPEAIQVINEAKEINKSIELDTDYWVKEAVIVEYEEKDNEVYGRIVTRDGLILIVEKKRLYDCMGDKCYGKTRQRVSIDSIHSSYCEYP